MLKGPVKAQYINHMFKMPNSLHLPVVVIQPKRPKIIKETNCRIDFCCCCCHYYKEKILLLLDSSFHKCFKNMIQKVIESNT